MISKFDYTYDAVGRIQTWKQFNSAAANPQQFSLGYDGSDWLTGASLASLATSGTATMNTFHYAYDAAGNRTSQQVRGRVTASTANNLNQLVSQAGGSTLHVAGTVSKPSTVDVNGVSAPVGGDLNFAADVPVTTGSNTIAVTATSGNGQVQTNQYGVKVIQGASKTFGYDFNGNMTGNGGTQTYEWNAVNRLLAINYTGTTNRTEFTYNGLGQRVQIVEKTGGSVTGTKQFVWMPGAAQPGEERNGSNVATKRFYAQGEQIGGVSYYYTSDHLGSIREMTNGSGAVVARYDYHLYGRRSKLSGSVEADFGYAGYYAHAPSSLDLTMFRAYDPEFGRWISRDPIGEHGGINLYGYVLNNPIGAIDPFGRSPQDVRNIVGTSEGTIGAMTQAGQRTQSGGGLPFGWAMNNDLQLTMGRAFFGDNTLLGCGDQSLNVMNALQHQKYDDTWNFSLDNSFPLPHQYVTATSSNPSDPVVTVDPYNNYITVTPPAPPPAGIILSGASSTQGVLY